MTAKRMFPLASLFLIAAAALSRREAASVVQTLRRSAATAPVEEMVSGSPEIPAPPVDSPTPTSTDWIYEIVREDTWSEEEIQRLKSEVESASDPAVREVVLWALFRCPSSEIVEWIDGRLRSSANLQEKDGLLLVLSMRPEAEAGWILGREADSHDPIIREGARRALEIRTRNGLP